MRCNECALPERFPKIQFDKKGTCNYCNDYHQTGAETSPLQSIGHISEKLKTELLNCKSKEEFDALVSPSEGIDTSYFLHRVAREKGNILNFLREDLENTLEESKGKGEYDCLVALSGGKDSTYLVHHLKEERGLKVLACTVKPPVLSDVALGNINITVKKLKVPHTTITPPEDLYIEMYRSLLTRKSHPDDYMHTVCYVCGPLMQDIALNTAVRFNIPLVITGYAPAQPDHLFYEVPPTTLKKQNMPKEFDKAPFTDFFWDPSKFPDLRELPRILAPYHVMDYNADEIMEKVMKLGLVSKAGPLETNCDLAWLMVYLNVKNLGFFPLADEFSTAVRRGLMSRDRVVHEFNEIQRLVKENNFRKDKIDLMLNKLDLKLEDLLAN